MAFSLASAGLISVHPPQTPSRDLQPTSSPIIPRSGKTPLRANTNYNRVFQTPPCEMVVFFVPFRENISCDGRKN